MIYYLYNENFEITHARFFNEGEQPENAIFIEVMDFIKPKINPITKEVYEGATPEEIEQQENQLKQQLKQQAYEELLPTDWYIVRFIETGVPVPEQILQQRQAIRNKYN